MNFKIWLKENIESVNLTGLLDAIAKNPKNITNILIAADAFDDLEGTYGYKEEKIANFLREYANTITTSKHFIYKFLFDNQNKLRYLNNLYKGISANLCPSFANWKSVIKALSFFIPDNFIIPNYSSNTPHNDYIIFIISDNNVLVTLNLFTFNKADGFKITRIEPVIYSNDNIVSEQVNKFILPLNNFLQEFIKGR